MGSHINEKAHPCTDWRQVTCTDRQNRFIGATCARDKETKKGKKNLKRQNGYSPRPPTSSDRNQILHAGLFSAGIVLIFKFRQNRFPILGVEICPFPLLWLLAYTKLILQGKLRQPICCCSRLRRLHTSKSFCNWPDCRQVKNDSLCDNNKEVNSLRLLRQIRHTPHADKDTLLLFLAVSAVGALRTLQRDWLQPEPITLTDHYTVDRRRY